MPSGEHPNSKANLAKGKRFNEENAREMAKKSHEARATNRSLNADLREQCTPEVLAEINKRLLQMAKHGNLKAYELLRDGLGEKPKQDVSMSIGNSEKLDDIFAQISGDGLKE